MGKIAFDPTMNKWFKYFDGLSPHSNPVFFEGYDDPTYLTFKVEFGDWGASVLDLAVIDSGVTLFKIGQADYDQLPIGLLNCPSPGQGHSVTEWQTGATLDSRIFNNQTNYSAFTYLRSRNEDVRAEYMYYFVNGLREIQRSTPYLFLKITGLDSLEQFDVKRGMRLSGAKITLECLENIGLKIKTLMELYRKAAWDDIYQRWIIPENLREFKMIIYVFERRTFQNSEFGVDKLNYEIPVKAYECCPCEFDLTTPFWKGDRDVTGDDGMETTNLVINVKNVKSYFRNGLLNSALHQDYASTDGVLTKNNAFTDLTSKLEPLLIYDLASNLERRNTVNDNDDINSNALSSSATTLNGTRALFMNKKVFLSNQEFSGMENTNATWIKTLVNTPSWDKQQSFWKNVGNAISTVVTSARRSIMVGADSDLYTSSLNTEAFNHLFGEDDEYMVSVAVVNNYDTDRMDIAQNMYGYSPDGGRIIVISERDLIHIHPDYRPLDMIEMQPMENYREKVNSKLEKPDNNYRLLKDLETSNMDDYRELSDIEETELEAERDLPIQSYPTLETRNKEDQQLLLPDEYRDLPDYKITKMDDPRELSDPEFTTLDSTRELPDPEFSTLEDERELPDQEYPVLEDRELSVQEFMDLDDPREKPEQTYPELEQREITLLEFLELEGYRELPKASEQKNDNYRAKNEKVDAFEYEYRKLKDADPITLDDIRKLDESDLTNLSDVDYRLLPNYKMDKLQAIDVLSKAVTQPSEKFVELDAKYRDAEQASITSLKENQTLRNLEFTDTTNEEDKRKLDLIKFAKQYIESADEMHDAMVEHIIKVKDDLKKSTEQVIRELPEPEMYQLQQADEKKQETALVSLNDVHEINKNIQLVSLDNDAIRDMSIQSLVALNSELEDLDVKTQALIGLTDKIEKRKQDKPVEIDTKSLKEKKHNKKELIKPEDKTRTDNLKDNMVTLL